MKKRLTQNKFVPVARSDRNINGPAASDFIGAFVFGSFQNNDGPALFELQHFVGLVVREGEAVAVAAAEARVEIPFKVFGRFDNAVGLD